MGLVYSYLRFSDPKQAAGSSADRQAAYAARWAAEHGLELDESLTLRDEGLSAYHQRHVKHGALGVFLAAVEQGRIVPGSVLVVEGLDRLSRAEPILAQAQLAQIINAGLTVVTASDGKAYSRETLRAQPMDLVYSLLVMIRAHEESDTKSRRVRAAIVRQCEGWLAGTYRGRIRNGRDPAWLAEGPDGTWHEIPDRAAAVRHVLQRYRAGWGPGAIVRDLEQQGMSPTGATANDLMLYRLVRQSALAGYKELSVDGRDYLLPGYYPAILTDAEWQSLCQLVAERGKRKVSTLVPGVITGLGITSCGYCGSAMVGQAYTRRNKRPDGVIQDGHRRLLCVGHRKGPPCPVAGSMSVAPVERAIMAWCADKLNLQLLMATDPGDGLRSRLVTARAELAALDAQIERLTDAMLAADADGGTPLSFARRARDLETQRGQLQSRISQIEADLAANTRGRSEAQTDRWAALAHGVDMLDHDARLEARELVAATFAGIVIYHQGLEPPERHDRTAPFVVLLQARGGGARMLTIARDGTLLDSVDATAPQGL